MNPAVTRLFLVEDGHPALNLPEQPFENEVEDLEAFVKANAGILGDDVVIFARQVDTGVGGRIDLLGLDRSRSLPKLVLVELKNRPADDAVLLQVLRYADWLSDSPDSIRLLLERSSPTVHSIDLEPRIVVVAPELIGNVVKLSQHVRAFEFTFLQIKRFKLDSRFVVVAQPIASVSKRSRGVSDRREWSWERYESELGWSADLVQTAQSLVSRLENVTQDWRPEAYFYRGQIDVACLDGNVVFGVIYRKRMGVALWFELKQNPEQALPEDVVATMKQESGDDYLYLTGDLKTLSDDQLRRLCEAAMKQAELRP
jgi:hypothetical protein